MSVLFQAEDDPAASDADYWRRGITTTIAPVDVRLRDSMSSRSRIRAGDAGAIRIIDMTVPPAEVVRTSKLIRQSDPDLLTIDIHLEGQLTIEQNDRGVTLRPGDITLVDLAHPARWTNDVVARAVVLALPWSALPLHRNELTYLTGVGVPAEDAAAQLIPTLASQLVRRLDAPHVGARLGRALLDLLTVALADRLDRDRPSPESHDRVLLVRVQAFIDDHLGNPELTPQLIADAHHISVRHLYSVFAAQGEGVAAYIRRRRLNGCRRDLRDPKLRTQPISAIGARWGLASPEHFSRAFKATFGVPPREYRDAHDHRMRGCPGSTEPRAD